GQETDIGLTWEVIRDENGNVSEERLAFRPFLRRTGHKSGQQSKYENAPAQAAYYWYPGDRVKMSVEIVEDGVLKFIIEGEGKRVNAIDQVRNEGKPAQATKTSVSGSVWHYTTLIRMEKGQKVDAPMHAGRYTSMVCPLAKHFALTQSEDEKKTGSENINISGAGY